MRLTASPLRLRLASCGQVTLVDSMKTKTEEYTMTDVNIDRTRIRMTEDGEVIVPLEIWERLLKIAEEAEGGSYSPRPWERGS